MFHPVYILTYAPYLCPLTLSVYFWEFPTSHAQNLKFSIVLFQTCAEVAGISHVSSPTRRMVSGGGGCVLNPILAYTFKTPKLWRDVNLEWLCSFQLTEHQYIWYHRNIMSFHICASSFKNFKYISLVLLGGAFSWNLSHFPVRFPIEKDTVDGSTPAPDRLRW